MKRETEREEDEEIEERRNSRYRSFRKEGGSSETEEKERQPGNEYQRLRVT